MIFMFYNLQAIPSVKKPVPGHHGNQPAKESEQSQSKGGNSRSSKPATSVRTVLKVKKLTDGQIEQIVSQVTGGDQAIALLGKDNITSSTTKTTTQVTQKQTKGTSESQKKVKTSPKDMTSTSTARTLKSDIKSVKTATSKSSDSATTSTSGGQEKAPPTASSSSASATSLSQNQMELLELEMRARAIKSMLKRQAGNDS